VLAECGVRFTGADWRAVASLSSRVVDEASPFLVRDPILFYGLTPGSSSQEDGPWGRWTSHVDAWGYREPAHPLERVLGGVRILCVGGSNVFGPGVSDPETWPARLEEALNSDGTLRFEVWNGGVSGYNPWQACRRGAESVELLRPDLVVVGLSNKDLSRHFPQRLSAQRSFFEGDPDLWLDLFPPRLFEPVPRARVRTVAGLLDHVAVLRLGVAVRAQWDHRHPPEGIPEPVSLEPTRACLADLATRTRVVMFVGPYGGEQDADVYVRDLDIPVVVLSGRNLPEERRLIHPSAAVLKWYGTEVARLLRERHLVPRDRTAP